jgi:AraC-like DNA-binding protein
MPELFEVPEDAIRAYERLSGLRVTVHDRSRALWRFLSPSRSIHRISFCEAVKGSPRESACLAFARDRLPPELVKLPEGRVHVCHAGLVECVVPLLQDGEMKAILFANVRTPGRRLRSAVRFDARTLKPRPWPKTVAMPPPLDDEEAGVLLEGLRQLAARLNQWMRDWERVAHARAHRISGSDEVTRGALMRGFLQSEHAERVTLADLARALHLGESRTAHAVREICGKTFVELLTEARIRSAANLLRASELPIVEVAYRNGFGDLSHFHRVFKRSMKMTPRRYRRLAEERVE